MIHEEKVLVEYTRIDWNEVRLKEGGYGKSGPVLK